MLQFSNRIGRPHVLFTAHAESVFATGIQMLGQYWVFAKGCRMQALGFFRHLRQTYAFNVGGGASKVLINKGAVEADGFKYLCTTV